MQREPFCVRLLSLSLMFVRFIYFFGMCMSITHSHHLIIFPGVRTPQFIIHSTTDGHEHGFQFGAILKTVLATFYPSLFVEVFHFPKSGTAGSHFTRNY